MQEEGQLVSVESLRSLLESSLPTDEIVYAFAYGSGVLSQQQQQQNETGNDNAETKMIDFVVAVRDSYRFHQENLTVNADHYARPFVCARDRARRLEWWQRHNVIVNRFFRNPGLYFNVTDRFKYGVVQVEDLKQDLRDWSFLYLAGRMHKPIVTILDREPGNNKDDNNCSSSIQFYQDNCNLPAAVSAALLLLWLQNHRSSAADNANFVLKDSELYTQIAALSFTGDPRMTAGAEDPAKVTKLVHSTGQLQRFRQLYANALAYLEACGVLTIVRKSTQLPLGQQHGNSAAETTTVELTWDKDNSKAHSVLWGKLPVTLQQRLFEPTDHTGSARAFAAFLPTIVAPAARYQSIKGLATAGLQKSWSYALRKLSKGVLKRR